MRAWWKRTLLSMVKYNKDIMMSSSCYYACCGISFNAYSIRYILAMDSYATVSPALNMFPASQFKGESASGFPNKITMARQADYLTNIIN